MIKIILGVSVLVLIYFTWQLGRKKLLNNDRLFLLICNYILSLAVFKFVIWHYDKLLGILSGLFLSINTTLMIWDLKDILNKYLVYGYFGMIIYLLCFLF